MRMRKRDTLPRLAPSKQTLRSPQTESETVVLTRTGQAVPTTVGQPVLTTAHRPVQTTPGRPIPIQPLRVPELDPSSNAAGVSESAAAEPEPA